jgi:hypothetical protein
MSRSEHPKSMAETTARLRARFDTHAATLGEPPSFRPVPVERLASTIRSANETRRSRMSGEELANARTELALALDLTRESLLKGDLTIDHADLLHGALLEYIGAQHKPVGRSEALQAMRSAIASLEACRLK